jgi:translocation and assembly module TamB
MMYIRMKKAFKIIIYTLCSILILVLIAVGLLTTPAGENFVREKAVTFLRDKLKTEVQIGKLNYTLPTMIELGDVLLKDQQNDTLLSVGSLRVDISMLKLLSNRLEVNKIELRNGVVNLYRTAPDTTFNFDYIAKAFSSPPDPAKKDTPTDTSGRMELNVHKLVLSYIDVRFDDYTGGSRFNVKLDTLYAGISKVDPYHMDFGLTKLYVNNLAAALVADTSYLPKVVDTTNGGPLPFIAADELDLNNVSFEMSNRPEKFFFSTSVHQLTVHPKIIDLNSQNIGIADFSITKAAIKIKQGKTKAQAITVEKIDTTKNNKWRVIANTFKIDGLDFFMDDENKAHQKTGIDYAHLGVEDLMLDAEKVWYTTDTIAATLNNVSVKEQSGLNLKKLQTTFAYYPQGAYLHNLYLETDNTLLRNMVEIKYPSIDALSKSPQLVEVKINIDSSVVGMRDIVLLAPQLQTQPLFRKYGKERLNLTAIADGKMSDLDITKFVVDGPDNTHVNIDGNVGGLPDAGNLKYNLKIHRLQSTRSLIAALLPATLLKQINPPAQFNITGHVSGTTTVYNPDLMATTSDGNLLIQGTLSIAKKGNEHYDLRVKADKLNVGKLLRKDTLIQYITANVTAKGNSFHINTMNAMLKGEIQSAGFKGYNYSNINFEGKVADKNGNIDLVSKDPNAVLSLNAKADFKNKYPAVIAKLIIDSTDLQALKFSKDELKIHANVDADFPVLNPDYPDGKVVINKPVVRVNGERYMLDSLYVSSTPTADSGNYVVVNMDVLQAVISGHTPLSQIGNIVQSHINRHYNPQGDTTVVKTTANYDLAIKAVVIDRPLLHTLLPGLKYMDTIKLDAGVTPNTLFANIKAPRLQYSNMEIYNVNADVKGADSAFTYGVTVDKFMQDNLQFWYTSIGGNIRNKEITTRINIADSAKSDRFSLGAVYTQARDSQKVSITNPMKLNYKDWQVSTPNTIVLGKDGLYIQNFRISSGGESISINSETPQFISPMVVAINDFMLSNITEIISKDTLLADGVLNTNLSLKNITTNPEIAGTLGIRNLSVLNDTIGNVDAELKSANANEAEAKIAINGRGNDVVLTGFYYPQPVNGNNFDLTLDVNAINVQSMEGLAMQQIKSSSGYVRGKLKITGTITKPVVVGELHTDNLQTTVTTLGAPFKMPTEKILFTQNGIEFDNFKIVDEQGQKATISGKINTTDFKNLRLDLNLRARKFQALNSEKKQDQLFYGRLLFSSNLNINGTTSAPKVDGSITIHDSTKFTVAIPKKQAGIEERKGIVEFVDMDDTANKSILPVKQADSTIATYAFNKGTDINVNVEIEKQATFNVIIDEGTGDFLSVKGNATLNTAMRQDGSLGITGKYELNNGFYELNYNLIKRRFEIQPGSAIIFTGDPLTANVDITAIYTANIPPYDLVEKQVSDPAQLVYYKQRIPFQVKLKLSGEILKPEIAFDITLPENKGLGVSTDVSSLVEAKLSQIRSNASELNKQVFAVLILNRFVADNPFESGTSTSAEFIARQSVSRFISEQLNNFAKDLVGGIDLSLDLESSEDYTSGQKRNRTDLNVAASKRLLNDRLTITVGNNFGLEGQSQTKQNTSLIPGNLSADYQLSRDGRYMIRLYRKNDNTDILQGYVIETGTSFIITLEYNRFRNLFINRKKQIQRMRQEQSKGAGN